MTTVYTGGTFDLLHKGHLELLEACRRMGDLVVVGLNTDEFIARFKDRPPFQPYEDRRDMLLGCRYVDVVVPNVGEEDSTKTIQQVIDNGWAPKGSLIVAIGTDWAGRDYYKQMGFTTEWLDEKRIVLVYVDRRTGESTTDIKRRLQEYGA